MISRRALFGLSVGAVAACVVPVRPTRAVDALLENHPVEFMRWSETVNIPIRTGYVIHLYDAADFSHVERGELEVDIRFDDPVPNRWLK